MPGVNGPALARGPNPAAGMVLLFLAGAVELCFRAPASEIRPFQQANQRIDQQQILQVEMLDLPVRLRHATIPCGVAAFGPTLALRTESEAKHEAGSFVIVVMSVSLALSDSCEFGNFHLHS